MAVGDDDGRDERTWLEDVLGEEALAWVRERNRRAEDVLFTDPRFEELRAAALGVLEAEDRIPTPSRRDDDVWNTWTDAQHRRGIVRRTSWAAYRAGADDWDVVLDVDALGAAEGRSWTLAGLRLRRPDGRRMLVDLSDGGSDASHTREYDVDEHRFVGPDEGGFARAEGKGSLTWGGDDVVFVCAEHGEGTLTTSGYPRTVRRWVRGTPLEEAPVVFEGEASDVSVGVDVSHVPGHEHVLLGRALDFYRQRFWLLRGDDLVPLALPEKAAVEVHGPHVLVVLRERWEHDGTTYAAGSAIVADVDALAAGTPTFTAVFTPTDATVLDGACFTRTRLVLKVMEHVRARVLVADPDAGWTTRPLAGAPDAWCLESWAADPIGSDDVFLRADDLLTPPTLLVASAAPGTGPAQQLRRSPDRFPTAGLVLEQRFVASDDGTQVPYFVVRPEDAGGPRPALLDAYGGFEVANVPSYRGVLGATWLARGGVYALANIRGGGEYGPRWHDAALRERRPRAYEDLEAVARDLVARGDTTVAQLGVEGGSNGGLLVGNAYVRHPELWGAVVCLVPLLDLRRYHRLLAGASWMAEYGDPDDPADWAYLQGYSPYHLVDPATAYPPILLSTSTRDDRVHPGHARKMAALLEELGKDVTSWENVEGGHGMAADAEQQAKVVALTTTFLLQRLGDPARS